MNLPDNTKNYNRNPKRYRFREGRTRVLKYSPLLCTLPDKKNKTKHIKHLTLRKMRGEPPHISSFSLMKYVRPYYIMHCITTKRAL